MSGTFSPESRIEAGLRNLSCSGRAFVEIARAQNIRIAHGPFSEGLRKGFEQTTANKLLDTLDRMLELQRAVGIVPINWGATQEIVTALTIQCAAKCAAEFGDHSLDQFAELAIKRI